MFFPIDFKSLVEWQNIFTCSVHWKFDFLPRVSKIGDGNVKKKIKSGRLRNQEWRSRSRSRVKLNETHFPLHPQDCSVSGRQLDYLEEFTGKWYSARFFQMANDTTHWITWYNIFTHWCIFAWKAGSFNDYNYLNFLRSKSAKYVVVLLLFPDDQGQFQILPSQMELEDVHRHQQEFRHGTVK